MTKEEYKNRFIEQANKKYNNKYDYSKVKYINRKTQVIIICPIHGEFSCTPQQHLGGKGCTLCAKNGKLNTESFVQRSKEVHGDKYDYNKVDYKNAQTKVCIICHKKDENGEEHGEFWQFPSAHYRGQGCPYCSGRSKNKHYKIKEGSKKISESRTITTEQYLQKVYKTRNNVYDYSKVNFKNYLTKICIICHEKDENGEEHGEFWQYPSAHLKGHNCPKCGDKQRKETVRQKAEANFIEKSSQIHKNKYDYSKVRYVDLDTKVCIICHEKDANGEEHGEFWQTPGHHMHRQQGCPHCNVSKLKQAIWDRLKKENFNVTDEKTFEWLTYEHNLLIDLFLIDYNIAIECQGEQHFYPIKHFGGKEALQIRIQRDLRKIELCKKNGITLLHYATCNIPSDFNLYPIITSEEELIEEINRLIKEKEQDG